MDSSPSYLQNCNAKLYCFQTLVLNENAVLTVGRMGMCLQM